ncbi:hypothetical protein [Pseudoxanthomonas suwonensis]|uniref:hypothetical protein n=1 Tax=Pseudoxanthomonas suwonensis TaxID=314722 RepID=UPI000A7BD6EC|nr:hypothetical protein [Pseudoxanthomonas suwonensis]
MSRILDFVRSDAGALARFQKRSRRRVRVLIDDIEPQSKKMPGGERDKFQTAVAEQMALARRSAFRKDVALRLDLATTSKTAPQAHTIAKNLLDLLGEKRAGVDRPGRHLLYADDKQIQALSVSCRHGERNPGILIEARPFGAMLDDLELAAEATRIAEMTGDGWHRADQDSDAIDDFRDLRRNEPAERGRLGDELYDALFKMTRWSAQRALLSRSRLSIPVLSWLYGLPRGVASGFGVIRGFGCSVNPSSACRWASCQSLPADRTLSGKPLLPK